MLPFVNVLVTWIPVGVYFVLMPIAFAWLLGDIGTESRSPLSFFKSFIQYHGRKLTGNSYYRNRLSFKPRTYTFNNYFAYQTSTPHLIDEELEKKIESERQKTLNYIERIEEPELFFKKLKESEVKPNKRFRFFKRKKRSD